MGKQPFEVFEKKILATLVTAYRRRRCACDSPPNVPNVYSPYSTIVSTRLEGNVGVKFVMTEMRAQYSTVLYNKLQYSTVNVLRKLTLC